MYEQHQHILSAKPSDSTCDIPLNATLCSWSLRCTHAGRPEAQGSCLCVYPFLKCQPVQPTITQRTRSLRRSTTTLCGPPDLTVDVICLGGFQRTSLSMLCCLNTKFSIAVVEHLKSGDTDKKPSLVRTSSQATAAFSEPHDFDSQLCRERSQRRQVPDGKQQAVRRSSHSRTNLTLQCVRTRRSRRSTMQISSRRRRNMTIVRLL
eukprot:SAG11_NODE_3663_length_2301_cov_1.770209_1_plen_206_part_00